MGVILKLLGVAPYLLSSMSDYCNICETRRPTGGTNHLVLNGGELWIEFCKPCGEAETLTNPKTKETITIQALFNRTNDHLPNTK